MGSGNMPNKRAGPKPKKIEKKLPGFVATGDLFSWVVRGSVKRAWDVRCGICHTLSMRFPDCRIPEGSPSPELLVVRFVTIYCRAPQWNYEIGDVECREVHNIQNKQ